MEARERVLDRPRLASKHLVLDAGGVDVGYSTDYACAPCGYGGGVVDITDEAQYISELVRRLRAENARLQAHIKVLDERGMQASLYVRLSFDRDRLQTRVEELEDSPDWTERLRWKIDEAKVRDLLRDRDHYKVLAERRKEALEIMMAGSSHGGEQARCLCPRCRQARAAIEEEVR